MITKLKTFFAKKNNLIAFLYFFTILFINVKLGYSGLIFFGFSLFIGYVILFLPSTKGEELKFSIYFLIIPIVFILAGRALPFIEHGSHPLGYDTGFYIYNIEKEREIVKNDWVNFNRVTAGEDKFFGQSDVNQKLLITEVESIGGRLINKLMIVLGFSDWFILYGLLTLAGLILGALIYLISANYFGKTAAFYSTLIFSLSFTQYLAFYQVFWKNILSLAFMLAVFYLQEKEYRYKYLFIVPAILFIILLHKSSSFILLATLGLYFILKKNKGKYVYLAILALIVLTAAWLNQTVLVYLWEQLISGFKSHYDFFSVKEGIFVTRHEYLKMALFYLPFGLLAAWKMIIEKKRNIVLYLLAVSGIIILTKFIFYRRIIIFFDLALLILSGYVLELFFNQLAGKISKKFARGLAVLIFSVIAWSYFSNIQQEKPLMSRQETLAISQIGVILPTIAVFTYDSYYTPWLYGFSGHKIIAPGWGDFKWNLKDWERFWRSGANEQTETLRKLHQPLLIYYNNKRANIMLKVKNDPCFQQISDYFFYFNCH
jgi:hypothetical protein